MSPWTRTYFVQQILSCGLSSAKVDIFSRFVTFFHSLRESASYEVQFLIRFLARDIQSVTGRNLSLIQETAKVNPWNASHRNIKDALGLEELVEVPETDRWRLRYFCS